MPIVNFPLLATPFSYTFSDSVSHVVQIPITVPRPAGVVTGGTWRVEFTLDLRNLTADPFTTD